MTVSGAAAGGAAADPPAAALTIRDDDRAPGARLTASPASISENGGVATVTAALSHPSSGATTVTVTPLSGAYTVDAGAARIVIPAGRTEPAEGSENAAAAVTAVDDGIDEPDRQVTVVGTMANAQGVGGVSGAPLTIADDDAAATVTLAAAPASISENGGVATVTATLSGPPGAAVTVTVTGIAGAYTAGPDATIVIPAGETRNVSDTATVAAVDDDVWSGAAGRRVTVTGAASSGTGAHPVVGAALTLAEDEAAPAVTLAVSPGSISENGGEATVSATLSGPSAAATTVTVTPVAGAYAAGSDATIVIAAGATANASDTATVAAVDDDLHQGSAGRSVTVTGAAASGVGAGSVTGAALTLADDGESLPTASLALAPASISEDGGVSTVTAALSAPSSQPVTVTVTAAPGRRAVAADFSLSAAATLTIAAGATASAGTVTVSAAGDDAVHEPDREVTVSGAAAGGNGVADPADATLAIADDEALPTVTLALTPSTISETGGVSTVTAALSHPSSEAVTVTIQAAPGDHARAADFALSAARTLTIAAGSTTSAGRVTVTAAANSANAPDKTVTVTGAAAGGNGAADPADATLTIADDDGMPRLTLSPADPAWEGHTGAARTSGGFRYANAGQLNFIVRIAPQSERPITVELADATSTFSVTSSSGRATAGADYTAFAGRTLTIPPRAAQFSFHATVLDDAVDEGKAFEAVIAELRNPVNAEIPSASAGRAEIYIREDDAAGLTVTETASSTRTTEAGGTDTFTVALASKPAAAVTVTLSVPAGAQDEGELSVGGGAYGSTATLTFAPAAWSAAQTVTVRGKDESAADGDQTWAVTLDPDSGDAVYGGLTSATLSVTNADDDPAAGLVVVETGGSTVTAEAATSNLKSDSFTVALARKPAADVTVTVSIPAGAQDEGVLADPEKPGIGFGTSTRTLTFKADDNTWSTAQTVTVTGKDDGALDGHQTYAVTLNPDSTDAAYRALGNASVSVTNLDDDARASVTLTLTPSTIAEGAIATVTASLSEATGQRVTVTVSAAGASASSGDFTLSAANTLTIDHRSTESTGTVTIAAADDAADEPNETVTISATAATAASPDPIKVTAVSSPLPVALTITDTDAAPTVTLALAPSTIAEGGVATVTARLSHPSAAPTTVTVFPAAGGAARVASDATIVIPAGRTANASDTATIAAVDNRRDEADRSATVTATAANGLGAGAVTGAALAITDDDNPPLLHIDSPRVTEGASGATATMTFTVRLGVASGRQVTVAWADAETGAATAGADYATVAGGTLTFAAGETSKTVAVTVNGDDGDEPDETVVIALSAPVNATLSAARGIGTILDDDATPTLSIAAAQVTEGDGGSATLSFPVRLSAASGTTVTVDYADAGTGTADSGTDYAAIAAGTLTFLAGETSKTIAVAVTGDGADEPDETVVVRLSAPSRATLPAATATGTIADDDDPPELSISSPRVAEGNSGPATLRFTVELSAASGRQVAVSYAEAAGGTATAGTDYTALAAGALTFAAGETSKNVDVTVAGDALDEPNETVVVRLSGPTNATLPATAATRAGTIVDDDPPPSVSIDSPAAAVTADSGATLRFKVELSAASSRQVTVNYAEGTGGTATRGTDYTALAAGALTFAAGETSKSLDVAVAAGASDGRTVVVTLSGPVNATLGTATGTGTISEDLAPSFAASSLSRHFGRNRAIPTFTLPAATGGNGALTYAMASLPTGLVYAAPGATDAHGGRITGTPSANRGATVYRLTATDADGDRAALNVSITVSDAPGMQSMRIHGHQGQSLGGNVTTGQWIVFTLVFDQVVRATETGIQMKLLIGDKEREATRQFGKSGDSAEVIMEYQVRADDWDGDGISLPRRPFRFSPLLFLGPNQPDGSILLRSNFNVHAIYDIDARTQLSFTNRGDLRINDRSPSFGSATVADKSFVNGAPVWADDPVLPAATFPTPGVGETATDVNSPLTYTVTPALPEGLALDAATRAITGTPTEVSAAKSYTLTATDVDGDRTTLGFRLGVEEDVQPAFAADAAAAWTWTEDRAVSQILPAASGGNQTLTYALTGPGASSTLSLPQGLAWDAATRTISGTPTAEAAEAGYSLKVADRDGDDETLAVAITVEPRAPDAATGVSAASAVGALKVSWTAAAKADGYRIQWKSGTESYAPATRQATVSGNASTTYAITGLRAGREYTVRVISTRTGAPDGAASAEATGTPTNLTMALSSASISESGGVATVTAHLAAALGNPTTITVSAAPGTNAAADDFTLSGTTLTIASGKTASAGTVTIAAVDDEIDSVVDGSAAGKRVRVSGASSGAANPPALTLNIEEDDDAALVLAPALPGSGNAPWLAADEGATATFTVKLASQPTGAVTVTAASADDGEGKLSSGAGAPAASTALTFTAGDWNTAQTVTLTAVADRIDDGDVDYRLTLDPGGASTDAYAKLATLEAKARTVDVDEAGISISKTALTIGESTPTNDARTHFTVALASKPTADVTVTVTGGSLTDARVCLSGGGCAPSRTLTFTPGNWSTAQRLVAQGYRDELDEADEQVIFTLDPASADDGLYDGLASATLPVTIEDDDDPPALSVSAPSVAEGDSGEATLTWRVTLSPIQYCFEFLSNGTCGRSESQVGVSGREVTLDYADAGTGTAAAGTDYTAFAAGILTIAAGTTAGGTIKATVKSDTLHEADETVVLSLSDPGNAALAVVAGQTADTATGTIADDDPAPALSISRTARATEGDGGSGVPAKLTWTVTLNPESGREATVAWADAGTGTATSGVDYATIAGGTLTFAAGETRKTVEATVTGDKTDEADETVVVKLSAPTNAVLAVAAGRTADTGTGRIRDDDAPPVLSFSPLTASEGDSGPTTVPFEVELSAESGKVVTVDYADAGTGTAESGTDYTALAAGTLTFAAGDTTASVSVRVTGDTVNEPDETIVLKLSGAANATLAIVAGQTADTGAITIGDDDAATATLALTPDSIAENGGVSTVTAKLAVPSSAAVTIAVSAAPGAGGGGGRLRPERGEDADLRRGSDDERRLGDGDRERRRHRFAEQERDGAGRGVRRPQDGEPGGRDADDRGRRRRARSRAGARAFDHPRDRGQQRGHGDGDALAPVQRADDGDGGRDRDLRDRRRGFRAERGENADHSGGADGEWRRGDDRRGGRRRRR